MTRSTFFNGIENHTPDSRFPTQIPEGVHIAEISKAEKFMGGPSRNRPSFVAELKIISSEEDKVIGKTFAVVKIENEFPQYFLGGVRGFVAAALNVPVSEVTAQVTDDAINARGDSPGDATGKTVVLMVRENSKKPEFPIVDFHPAD